MTINKSKTLLAIPVVIAMIAVTSIIAKSLKTEKIVLTGIVESSESDVASKIPGRVDSVYVQEGDIVHKGQLLATLESKEMDAKVAQALALREAARSKMAMALHGARPEEKEGVENLYLQAKAQYELASKTWRRIERIYRDSLISTQDRDQAEFQFTAAREQMNAAKAKFDMVMKGARREEIDGATELFHQADNGYREALAYQQELSLKSPLDGEISKRITDPGEIIASGYPVFSVVNPKDCWVVLQVKENELRNIRKGSVFSGRVRALGDAVYQFQATYIAAMGDFATWKPTNQKGDFDVKTFEIHLRSSQPIDGMRPGMTVNIEL
ncbi:MAG: efflux RND transporter periplasmic adaptor subunit [Ignavibacteriales bacterium]|nr:efflux RND transporter periplasmic adaptor subunit [Ignavibacteriales bacterium]